METTELRLIIPTSDLPRIVAAFSKLLHLPKEVGEEDIDYLKRLIVARTQKVVEEYEQNKAMIQARESAISSFSAPTIA